MKRDLADIRADAIQFVLARPAAAIGIGGVLLVALIGTVLLSARGCSGAPTVSNVPQLPVADGYAMICKKCKAEFEIKRAEFETWPTADGAYKCPKCGSGSTEPDNSKIMPMVEVPSGG